MTKKKIAEKRRGLCLILCLVLCALTLGGCGGNIQLLQGEDYVMTEKRQPLPVYSVSFDIIGGKDTMPIGGFFGPYTVSQSVNGQALPDYVSDKYFKMIRECGINLIVGPNEYFTAARSSVVEALTLAEKYGIGYFAQDAYVYDVINGRREPDEELARLLTQLNEYPAFVGMHTQDEPQTGLFEGLGKFNDAFYSYGIPGKQTYSNLLPDYFWGVNYTGGAVNISYEEYVRQFIEKTHPRFLSYDHYVFDSRNYEFYFSNLAVVREQAQANGLPFWVFAQAGGQWNDAGAELPIQEHYPKEGEFMWNIGTQLAYGAKGIQYFPLFQPKDFAKSENGQWDYGRNGIFGAFGNRNEWYFYAQKANAHIAAVDHVLMNAANEGLIASGTALNDLGGRPEVLASGKYRELTGVSGNALVGCFDYLGGTALYVVNYSMEEKGRVTLSFTDNYGYDVTQRTTAVSVTGNEIVLTLEAGEGALVVLK